jgi:hypothetical protein
MQFRFGNSSCRNIVFTILHEKMLLASPTQKFEREVNSLVNEQPIVFKSSDAFLCSRFP